MNKGYSYKKFRKEQELKQKEYQKAGMSKYQIEQIFQFDKEQFLEELRYSKHTQPFPYNNAFDDDDGNNPLLKHFTEELTVEITEYDASRFAWVKTIENDAIYEIVSNLSLFELELITLIVFEGYSQKEVANLYHVGQSCISKKLRKVFNAFKAKLGGVDNV